MIQKGRQAMGTRLNHHPQDGENNYGAKLTKEQVTCIKRLYFTDKKTQAEISRILNVDRRNIWAIVHNKSWKNVGFDTTTPELISDFIKEPVAQA